jgi:hypothetical protein
MNWEALGAIGELLGALAVVITLIYLSIQLKQNTLAMRSSKLESWVATGSSINEFRATHADVLAKAFSGEELSQAEQMIVDALSQKLFLLMEATYLHYRDGTIDQDVYDSRLAGLLKALDNPVVRKCWEQNKGYSLTNELVQKIDSRLDDGDF